MIDTRSSMRQTGRSLTDTQRTRFSDKLDTPLSTGRRTQRSGKSDKSGPSARGHNELQRPNVTCVETKYAHSMFTRHCYIQAPPALYATVNDKTYFPFRLTIFSAEGLASINTKVC